MHTNNPALLFILIAGCTTAVPFTFAQAVIPAPGPAPLGMQAANADDEEDAPPALTREEQGWLDRLPREDGAAAARRGYAVAVRWESRARSTTFEKGAPLGGAAREY